MPTAAELARDPPDLSGERVVCLPDLFVDHLVEVPDWTGHVEAAGTVLTSGGGNLPGVAQTLAPGGQSANVARILAGLGVDAVLAAPTGPVGRALADHWLSPLGVDLELIDGDTSLTVAYETAQANVMVNDGASLEELAWSDLDPSLLDDADWVHVANWAQIGDGDAFLADALAACRERDVPVSVDPGDPRPSGGDHDLLRVLSEHPPDLVSVNEVEADALGLSPTSPVPTLPRGGPGPVVVHGADEATLILPDDTTVTAPSLDVDPVRRTGAGDAFNAGYVVGELLDLDDWATLELAHAVAAAHVTGDGFELTWAEVDRVVG